MLPYTIKKYQSARTSSAVFTWDDMPSPINISMQELCDQLHVSEEAAMNAISMIPALRKTIPTTRTVLAGSNWIFLGPAGDDVGLNLSPGQQPAGAFTLNQPLIRLPRLKCSSDTARHRVDPARYSSPLRPRQALGIILSFLTGFHARSQNGQDFHGINLNAYGLLRSPNKIVVSLVRLPTALAP